MNKYNYKIVFSWQSDVNNKLLRKVVESSITKLREKYLIDHTYYPCEDKSGSPDLSKIILNKIKECDVFIADLTNVGISIDGTNKKRYQNSNVCYELGLAEAHLDSSNIILLARDNEINDLFFDIKHNRITQYTVKNNEIICKDLDKYIEACFMFSSKNKILRKFNYTCPICLDNINIDNIHYYNQYFMYCNKCSIMTTIYDSVEEKKDLEDIFTWHKKNKDIYFTNHSTTLNIKTILQDIRFSNEQNTIDEKTLQKTINFCNNYYYDEYIIQYIEIIYNLFSICNDHILNINDLYPIIYRFFKHNGRRCENIIIQEIITYILDNSIHNHITQLINEFHKTNSDSIKQSILTIFKIIIILLSSSNTENKNEIFSRIDHYFTNKGLNYLFNHDVIKDQIEKYSLMIINDSSNEEFYKLEDYYFKLHHDECITITNIRFNK